MTGTTFEDCDCTALRIRAGDWSYTLIQELDLHGVRLTDVSFEQADLYHGNFDKAVLTRCNFRGANLTGASFRGADLRSSCIAETNLLEIDLRGAKIDLEQAVLLAGALGAVYEP